MTEFCETVSIPVCPVNVVVGHYGVGKTNFSLNWAIDLVKQGYHVTLADFDVVNPYFRSSDYTKLLEDAGVNVIAPILAGTSLDTPSISGAVSIVMESCYGYTGSGKGPILIIDAGGDDVGATVLGRFSESVKLGPYQMLYVVNKYRNLTQDVASALQVMREIEVKSKLKVTGIVNNSHLREYTDEKTILDALDFGIECAENVSVPYVCTTAPEMLLRQKNAALLPAWDRAMFYPVQMLVTTPWE